jgi:hypothetical protein
MPDPVAADSIDGAFAPARGAHVHTVVLDGEGVLLDEQENRLHLLNVTAALLWQLYDGATTLDELATDLSDELGGDRVAILADLVAITRRLGSEGLLADVAAEPEGEG